MDSPSCVTGNRRDLRAGMLRFCEYPHRSSLEEVAFALLTRAAESPRVALCWRLFLRLGAIGSGRGLRQLSVLAAG